MKAIIGLFRGRAYGRRSPEREAISGTLRLVVSLMSTLLVLNVLATAQSAQSIDVSPLVTGQNFTITVIASPDVTSATATFTFFGSRSGQLDVPLAQQGSTFAGSGLVPADIGRQLPGAAGATVNVTLFNAAGRRTQQVVRVPVKVESITGVFDGGILTVTGDDQDNTITVGRDANGGLLVNGGLVPITGGIATVANTSQIRIIGLKGNDVLGIDDSGISIPTNILGNEGNDTLTGGLGDDELDGGPGDDTLFGKDGADRLLGGIGKDFLHGGRGDDQLFGGEDDDVIDWLPGEGSDLVEGQDGQDTLLFVGSNASEAVDLTANGPRLRFFRNVGNITMDCDGIENVIFKAAGGADSVNVNDLTGTQVTNVAIDLLSTQGVGDGSADTVTVFGTAGNDTVTVAGSDAGVTVGGLKANVTVTGAEKDLDRLVVSTLAGVDTINASQVQTGAIALTLDGGQGDDTLTGGTGNDLIIGGQGTDAEFGGAGDDTSLWNPGDGNDVFEGQEGQDTLLFNGANIAEQIAVSANGPRLRFTRDIAGIVMDCDGTEKVVFNAKGGADLVTVNDLSGTAVRDVKIDLSATPGEIGGDNAADTVVVRGTTGDDVITVAGSANGISATGLTAAVTILGSEAANDRLRVEALAGNDVVTATGLPAGLISFTADGGEGDDNLVGSAGDDTLLGGLGDDILIGGPGQDVLDGGPGANVVIQ